MTGLLADFTFETVGFTVEITGDFTVVDFIPEFCAFILLTPVPPTYFDWIFEGFIPPGLFIIFAHFGICL